MNTIRSVVVLPREKNSAQSPVWERAFMALVQIAAVLVRTYPLQAGLMCVGALAVVIGLTKSPALPYSEARVTIPVVKTKELRSTEARDIVEIKPVKETPTNDCAPTTRFKSPEAFIRAVAPMAQGQSAPASIILAQALVESNAGTSFLAVHARNYFGHKCFSKNCGRGHCINRTDDTHKDFFRKYRSISEAFAEHANKITTGRYAKLKRHGRDYRAWAYGLKAKGYATDRTYAQKLIGVIERYELYKYDR